MTITKTDTYQIVTPADGKLLRYGDSFSERVLLSLAADASQWSEVDASERDEYEAELQAKMAEAQAELERQMQEQMELQMAEAQSQQQTDTDTETSTTTDTDTDDVLLKYVNDKTSSDYTDIGEAVKDLVDTATATD